VVSNDAAMIYLEFIERDRFVPIELFRYMGNQEAIWVEGETDRLLLQLGRTFRFGPMPSYLAFWQIPTMDRIDVWQEYFTSDAAFRNHRSVAMHRAVHVQRAGLYDELLLELADGRARDKDLNWYIEYFDAAASETDAAIRDTFNKRASEFRHVKLELLLRRVGMLGPDPANLAVWSTSQFENFERLIRSAPEERGVQVKLAGLYRHLGDETA
jgi:hypothetical protein